MQGHNTMLNSFMSSTWTNSLIRGISVGTTNNEKAIAKRAKSRYPNPVSPYDQPQAKARRVKQLRG